MYHNPKIGPDGSWSEALVDLLGWTFLPVADVFAIRMLNVLQSGLLNGNQVINRYIAPFDGSCIGEGWEEAAEVFKHMNPGEACFNQMCAIIEHTDRPELMEDAVDGMARHVKQIQTCLQRWRPL